MRRLIVVVLASMVLLGTTIAGSLPAQASGENRPILFLHGIALDAITPKTDCRGTFGNMSQQLRDQGWSGQHVLVGYYQNDTNCSVNLHNSARTGYDDRGSWKEMAKAFSWYVYDNYTSQGIWVNVVGYSMGGLIARGAVYGSQIGAPGFSPQIGVGNAATLGAPVRWVLERTLLQPVL